VAWVLTGGPQIIGRLYCIYVLRTICFVFCLLLVTKICVDYCYSFASVPFAAFDSLMAKKTRSSEVGCCVIQ
jgi:hypothetical protein